MAGAEMTFWADRQLIGQAGVSGQSLFFLHPTAEQIAAWVDGGLNGRERDTIEAHLVCCESCAMVAGNALAQQLEEQLRSDAS